jgi:nitrate reductase gamma subunit
MVAFIRGPMVWVALLVFVLGSAFQILRFFLLSRKATLSVHIPDLPRERKLRKQPFSERIAAIVHQLKPTVFAIHPLTMAVSTLFHLCLMLLPLFLLGHNELIELSIGMRLPSFPEYISDGFTLIVLFCCAFFLIRRVALARVRAISALSDYLVLALATVPFLSGFLAYHQIFDYHTMIIVHMISGELMLVAIPFTKLTHMTFFFFNRFLVVNEHTLGSGRRVW